MSTPPPDPPLSAPDDPAPSAAADSARAERQALGVFAVIAIAAIAWIARPVGVGILMGTLIAFSIQPLYERAVERTRRPALAALGCVVVSTIALVATMSGLVSLFISRGRVMGQSLSASLKQGGGLWEVAQKLAARLGGFEVHVEELRAKLIEATTELASRAAAIAATVATTTFDLLLALFFAMMTLSFVLRHWTTITLRAEDMLPLRPRYTRALLDEFQRVGRTTLLGTVVTGLAQGAFAAVGYWITGVPEPAFFGAATAVVSLVPGVGTLLVWVPAGLFLIGTGHPGMGALELVWGSLVVVGASDYIIRPRLVGGHGTMPALMTFAALFGGVEVFGLAGLILGPLAMSLSFAILRIFAQESAERRASGELHAGATSLRSPPAEPAPHAEPGPED
jgi:predicted PurR-regulated permease PerM